METNAILFPRKRFGPIPGLLFWFDISTFNLCTFHHSWRMNIITTFSWIIWNLVYLAVNYSYGALHILYFKKNIYLIFSYCRYRSWASVLLSGWNGGCRSSQPLDEWDWLYGKLLQQRGNTKTLSSGWLMLLSVCCLLMLVVVSEFSFLYSLFIDNFFFKLRA